MGCSFAAFSVFTSNVSFWQRMLIFEPLTITDDAGYFVAFTCCFLVVSLVCILHAFEDLRKFRCALLETTTKTKNFICIVTNCSQEQNVNNDLINLIFSSVTSPIYSMYTVSKFCNDFKKISIKLE